MEYLTEIRKIAKTAKISATFRADFFPIHPILGHIAAKITIPPHITIVAKKPENNTGIESHVCEPVRNQKWIAESIRDEICDQHEIIETITITAINPSTTLIIGEWTLEIMGIRDKVTTRMRRQINRLTTLMSYYLAYTVSPEYLK